jgi:hypothetical protein
MRHHKTRRNLKSRSRQRRTHRNRRNRRQRGGATSTSAKEWVAAAARKIQVLAGTDKKMTYFGDLLDTDLTIVSPTAQEREDATISLLDSEFEVLFEEGRTRKNEILGDVALAAREAIIKIVNEATPLEQVRSLDTVSLDKFRESFANTTDPEIVQSLKYLLIRENALRNLSAVLGEPFSTYTNDEIKSAVTTMTDALNKHMPMFVWALAINVRGDAEVVSLFSESELTEQLSEPRPLAPAAPAE